jgi:type IV pilus assembly protein PilC
VALFQYMALEESGERVAGKIQAPSREAAEAHLREQNYTILTISTVRQSTNVEDIVARVRPVRLEALVVFSRQLATTIASGMSPLTALNTLAEQERNPKFREIIGEIASQVEAGATLSDAFSRHPELFDTRFVAMVRAGEESGALPDSLRELANQLEKQLRLKRATKSATTYPKVVLVFAFLIISGLMMTIVPKFARIFVDTVNGSWDPNSGEPRPDDSLPAPTQFVLNISHLMYPETDSRNFAWWGQVGLRFLLFFAILYVIYRVVRRILREPGPRRRWDALKMKLPFRIGPLVQKLAIARFSRTFASLLVAGVPMTEALNIVSDTSGNMLISEALQRARARLLAGAPLYEPLARSEVFPPMVTRMIQVGEETGRMEEMLSRIADFYEEEVELAVRGLTSIIEPLMIIIVGGSIGLIVLVTYLPMFKIYELIG